MRQLDKRYPVLLLTGLFVIIADQASKWLIVSSLPEHGNHVVVPGFFDLVHYRNRGAAFGFLNSPHIEWQFWLFMVAAVLAMWFIRILARDAAYKTYYFIGLGLVLGGALGNLIDRIRFRSVVDFLDFSLNGWHWPAFNLADCAICVGGILVCYYLWKNPVTHTKEKTCQS